MIYNCGLFQCCGSLCDQQNAMAMMDVIEPDALGSDLR